MNVHPTSEQLERLLEEALSDSDRQQVEAHVNQCPECQKSLAHLTDTAVGMDWELLRAPTVPVRDSLSFLDRIKHTPRLKDGATATVRESRPQDLESLRNWQQSLEQEQEFRILEKLGHGGFGVVFKAYDTRLEQQVAIKVLHADLASCELQRARFEREARKAAAVKHDHVVTVHRLGHHDGLPFIVMEFIDGEPLSARLRREGKLPPKEAAEIVHQIALGLAAAHAQNVVHRDIKPSNILLDRKSGRARIADFGIAREIEGVGPKVTSTNERPGTLEYMSPEHLRDAVHLDGRTDLYSLGVLLYELLTGELPFRGQAHQVIQKILQEEPKPPRRHNERIPADLETITLRCLAKEPARRYQSAQELAADLERFLRDEPILARRVTRLERTVRWFKRRPAVTALLATSTIALLALIGVGVVVNYNSQLDALNQDLNSKRDHLETALGDLGKAKGEIEEAHGKLKVQNTSLKKAEGEARQLGAKATKNLYVAQMNAAHQAWEGGDTARVQSLLDAFRPKTDQADQRSFEWHYLNWLLKRGGENRNLDTGALCVAVHPGSAPVGKDLAPLMAMAVRGEADTIKLWKPSKEGAWKQAFQTSGQWGGVNALTFSSDGKYLAAATGNGPVLVWKVFASKLELYREPTPGNTPASGVAFTPGNKHLVSAHSDTLVKIWDLDTDKEAGDPLEHPWPVHKVAVSPDGSRLVCVGGNYSPDKPYQCNAKERSKRAGQVYVWDDFLQPQRKWHALPGHTDMVNGVRFSPDGKRLATASSDHFVRIFECESGKIPVLRLILEHRLEALAVAFSQPGGKYVVTAGWDMLVRIWDSDTGQPVRIFAGHKGVVHDLAFLPAVDREAGDQHDQIVSLDAHKVAKLWQMETDQRSFLLEGHGDSVLSAAFLNDNRQLVTLDKALKLRTWDITKQKLLHPPSSLAEEKTQGIILSPRADCLVLAAKNQAKLLGLGQHQGMGTPLGESPTNLDRIAFSADGKRLALAGADGLVVWDLGGPGKVLCTHLKPLAVNALALSPDGKRLAFVNGYQIKIWDLDTQSGPEDLLAGKLATRANHLAFTADGRLLASANQDNSVCLWDTHAGKKLPSLQGHMCHVSSVAFSPDGKRLASGSEDWTIRIWDLETGLTTLTLKGHQGRVLTVAFDSDGQQLVSTSEDGTARVWAAPVEDGGGSQLASGKNAAAK